MLIIHVIYTTNKEAQKLIGEIDTTHPGVTLEEALVLEIERQTGEQSPRIKVVIISEYEEERMRTEQRRQGLL